MGFPEGSGVEFRVLSYSSQSEYRMNKQQQQQLSQDYLTEVSDAYFRMTQQKDKIASHAHWYAEYGEWCGTLQIGVPMQTDV